MTERQNLIERMMIWINCDGLSKHTKAVSCADVAIRYHKEQLELNGVSRSKPIKEETNIIDYSECVWENPSYEQNIVDIDKSLDLEQNTEDKTLS